MPLSRIMGYIGIGLLTLLAFAYLYSGGFWGDPVFDPELRKAGGDVEAALKNVGSVQVNSEGEIVVLKLDKVVDRYRLPALRMNNNVLRHVKTVDTIRSLGVSPRTNINDNGMDHIAEMTQLEMLGLNGANITDRGLKKLEKLVNLKYLSVYATDVTVEGARSFKQAVPGCNISFGAIHENEKVNGPAQIPQRFEWQKDLR